MAVQYKAGAETAYQTLITEKAADRERYSPRDSFLKKVLLRVKNSEKTPQMNRAVNICVAW